MDDLKRMTITAYLSICLLARYDDDIFIMTKDKAAADKIFNKFNQQHSDIKFTNEYPSSNNELSLLDFKVMFADHKATFNYYQKDTKKNLFPHFRSVVPQSQKTEYVTNEYQRMTSECSTQSDKRKCHVNFLTRLSSIQQLVDKTLQLKISQTISFSSSSHISTTPSRGNSYH